VYPGIPSRLLSNLLYPYVILTIFIFYFAARVQIGMILVRRYILTRDHNLCLFHLISSKRSNRFLCLLYKIMINELSVAKKRKMKKVLQMFKVQCCSQALRQPAVRVTLERSEPQLRCGAVVRSCTY